MICFDSDYTAGAHPEVMRALMETNFEHSAGYGADEYSAQARDAIREACGCPGALVQFLVGGTQTNSTVIDALLMPHEGVLAARTGHISVHESGAIESYGHKVLELPETNGKVKAEDVDRYITEFYKDEIFEHMVAPGMLYISQPTELGTIYTLQELESLSAVCHRHSITLFADGARLGYALASPKADFTLKDIARLCDVFYIGGTKCGLLMGEAVVAPNPETLPHFMPLVKQHGALLAKGRILGLQFLTLFRSNLYIDGCRHAVDLAMKLRNGFKKAGYDAVIDSFTNQQFFVLPNSLCERLRSGGISFKEWGPHGEDRTTVRFVTSWASRDEDVETLLKML